MSRVVLEFPVPAIYRQSVKLRIDDINYGNHLGHDTLVSLLHDARCGWLAEQGLTELSVDGDSLGWVVAELIVNYRAEAFYGERLEIELALGKLGSKGVEIYQRVLSEEGVVIAVAKVGVVFFDYVARQAAAVPENFKQLAKKF